VGRRSPAGLDHPTVAWLLLRNAVTWWIVLRGMALDLLIGWHFSRVAEHVVLADPFDREVFAPFAGVRFATCCSGCCSPSGCR